MGRDRSRTGRVATAVVIAVAGYLLATSTMAGRGLELRDSRNADLAGMVKEAKERRDILTDRADRLRREVETLSRSVADDPVVEQRRQEYSRGYGTRAVTGPGVTVVLKDAPLDVKPVGVSADLLVVHQQDIHAVTNALWAGGAEAMTIQGQRITTATGIKCVGNTVVVNSRSVVNNNVVVDHVPYAPPYSISAIGDPQRLQEALDASPSLKIYRSQARAYQLGYEVRTERAIVAPAYKGATLLRYAQVRRAPR